MFCDFVALFFVRFSDAEVPDIILHLNAFRIAKKKREDAHGKASSLVLQTNSLADVLITRIVCPTGQHNLIVRNREIIVIVSLEQ